MPKTTDFVPFAAQAGALVENQATYVADTQTALGQQNGIADPANFNKAMRQATGPASALAQFMANQLNRNIPDDGNQNGFILRLWEALLADDLFIDSGAKNAVVIANPSGFTFEAPVDGQRAVIKPAFTCSGTTTINYMGLGVLPLRRPDNSELNLHDLIAGVWTTLRFNTALNIWQLAFWPAAQIPLSANLTIYVATTGSDSNDGTSGSPFRNIQHAVDVASKYSFNGFTITIAITAGTYTQANPSAVVQIGAAANGAIAFVVNGGGQVVINAVLQNCVNILNGASVTFTGNFAFTATSSSPGVQSSGCAFNVATGGLLHFSGVSFSGCTNEHIVVSGQVIITGSYFITGDLGNGSHFDVNNGGYLATNTGVVCTLSGGTRSIPVFARSVFLSNLNATNLTFSGSATGTRYFVQTLALINTAGAGANFFPGNVAGSADGTTGGYYI